MKGQALKQKKNETANVPDSLDTYFGGFQMLNRTAVNQHIKNILDDHELEPDSVIKKYLITAAELIYNRANAKRQYMGLTTWNEAPDGKIQQ